MSPFNGTLCCVWWVFLQKRPISPSLSLRCMSIKWRASTSGCNTLQHTAMRYNTLQHTTPHCNTRIKRSATTSDCNTLQHATTYGNALQHTATHCNALHYTATHVSTGVPRLLFAVLPEKPEREAISTAAAAAPICGSMGCASHRCR